MPGLTPKPKPKNKTKNNKIIKPNVLISPVHLHLWPNKPQRAWVNLKLK